MIPDQLDITAVLNVHCEGPLAHSSLRSMLDAKRIAEEAGLSVEAVVIVDRPDQRTTDYILSAQSSSDLRVVEIDEGDLAAARNVAVETAAGTFIAFLDGDDLWSDNWLISAHNNASQFDKTTVWHPECNLYFGESIDPYWFMHFDLDTPEAHWMSLALKNHWTALSFSARDVYQRVPYKKNRINRGFGYEDWAWNADTIDAGFDHRVVPGTVHLIRAKYQSLVRQTTASNALPTPVHLFRNRLRHGALSSYSFRQEWAERGNSSY